MMSGLGFEPRRITTLVLKTSPLDQLGHPDFYPIYNYLEITGIDPVTSRMQSERSTI